MQRGWQQKLVVYGALGAVCSVPLLGVVLRASGRVTRTDPSLEAGAATGPTLAPAPDPADPRAPLVTMYVKDPCPACDQARAWFDARKLPYRELDVDDDAVARAAWLHASPSASVPTLQIGNEVLVGYDADAIDSSVTRAVARRRFR